MSDWFRRFAFVKQARVGCLQFQLSLVELSSREIVSRNVWAKDSQFQGYAVFSSSGLLFRTSLGRLVGAGLHSDMRPFAAFGFNKQLCKQNSL